MLENDYILVQAELLVPFTLLFKTVLYKYIVQKTNAKGTEEIPQTLWENIPGRGIFCNRCLQVPKERCKPEGDCFYYVFFRLTIIDLLLQLFGLNIII